MQPWPHSGEIRAGNARLLRTARGDPGDTGADAQEVAIAFQRRMSSDGRYPAPPSRDATRGRDRLSATMSSDVTKDILVFRKTGKSQSPFSGACLRTRASSISSTPVVA